MKRFWNWMKCKVVEKFNLLTVDKNPMSRAVLQAMDKLRHATPEVQIPDITAIVKSVNDHVGPVMRGALVNKGDWMSVGYGTTGEVTQFNFGNVNPHAARGLILAKVQEHLPTSGGLAARITSIDFANGRNDTADAGVLGVVPVMKSKAEINLEFQISDPSK